MRFKCVASTLLLLVTVFGAAAAVPDAVPDVSASASESRAAMRGGEEFISGDSLPDVVAAPVAGGAAVQTAAHRSFFRRVGDYFKDASRDRTLEKKFDVTFIGGLSYSQATSLGFAVMAAGQYRVRRDSATRPSNVSMFVNVTLTGAYSVGVDGKTFFPNKAKMDYLLMFQSMPSAFWGVGYNNCDNNGPSQLTRDRIVISANYLYPVARNFYIGAAVGFDHLRAKNFSSSFDRSYVKTMNDDMLRPAVYKPEGQKNAYHMTGIGVVFEYDSRDFATEASKGIYLTITEKIYPKGLGNAGGTLWSTAFTADWYQKLWSSGTLAADLYGELRSAGTPWAMMSRLGGSYRMRGYYEGRYIDRNMITFQVELRQRIWKRIGCVVWAGAGNVFGNEPFSWGHTLPNYGLGLRWQFKHKVNIRVDYGFGRKSKGFVLNINEAF